MPTSTSTPTALAPPDPRARERLAQLLDAELAFDPRARGGFVNHTAMALVAAWRLGADADELERWFDDDTAEPQELLVPRDVPDAVIDRRRSVEEVGPAAAVRAAGPTVAPWPSAMFFHAPIRLELALDAGHPGQVANALVSWESSPASLAPLPSRRGDRDLRDVARDLAAAPEMGTEEGYFGPTTEAAWFRTLFERVDLDAPDLADAVAAVALMSHVAGDAFFSLHQVTGARAVRAVSRSLDPADARTLLATSAQAIAATLEAAGGSLPSPEELDDLRHRPRPDWPDIAAAARETGDHHVVKLVYAARLEEQETGDPLYPWVAARQAGMLT